MNDDRMRHTQKKPFLHKYNGGIHKNKNNFVGRSLYNRLQYRVHHHAASFAVTAFLIFIFALKQHYVFAGTTNIFTAIGFCFNQFFFLSSLSLSLFLYFFPFGIYSSYKCYSSQLVVIYMYFKLFEIMYDSNEPTALNQTKRYTLLAGYTP